MRMHQVLVATVAVIASAASPAFADIIVITGGSATVGSALGVNDPPFRVALIGDDTRITGITFSQGLSAANIGDTIDLSRTISISSMLPLGLGDQLVQGTRYTDVAFHGTLRFVANPVTFTDPSAGIHSRVTMDGVLSFFRQVPFEPRGELLFTTSVVGNGIATAIVSPRPGFFAFEGTTYDLNSPVSATPTPEPGTLALLGSGLAVAAAKLRRKNLRPRRARSNRDRTAARTE